ncbi:DUF3325 domain-containing protein [Dyella jejuensis]|uniref:DUF3325 domain-containing protein n=1 Tax=Dyella jejuensis TaxID=1432009 RepID=A0ABW8JIF4_9GAMM
MSSIVAVFALDYLSWALLCLGLPRHYAGHFGVYPDARRARLLRFGGWLPAGMAWALSVDEWSWDIGTVAWATSWMVAAMGWVVLQPYRPRLARMLAPTLLVLAVLCRLSP